jgi:HD-like signal output (HDOD) protein
MSAMRQPAYRVTPSAKQPSTPFTGWRLFVVTPDYTTLRRLQETLSERFDGIEFEANGASARARLADAFSPAFRMVMIDQQSLNDQDVAQWRKTMASMARKPFLMLLSRDVDNAPVRWAAELGCIGILNVNGPMRDLIKDLVAAAMQPQASAANVAKSGGVEHRAASVFDKLHPEATYLRKGPPAPVVKASDYGIPVAPVSFSQWPEIRPPLLPLMTEVSERVEQIPWLADAVMALASSRQMRQSVDRVESVERAIERIGLLELMRQLPWLVLHHEFAAGAAGEFGQVLWRYTIAGGMAFAALYQRFAPLLNAFSMRDVCLSGALRQVGMLLMHRKHPNYREIARAGFQADINSAEQCDWEQKRYGITHSVISYAVAVAWHQPDELCEAIRLQHQIEQLNAAPDPIQRLGKLFILADALAADWLFPNYATSLVNEPIRLLLGEFRLTLAELEDIKREVQDAYRHLPSIVT